MKLKRVYVSREQPTKAAGKTRPVSSLTSANGLATQKKNQASTLVRKIKARSKSPVSGKVRSTAQTANSVAPTIMINLSKLLGQVEGVTISLIEAAPGSGNGENPIVRINIDVPFSAVKTGPIVFP